MSARIFCWGYVDSHIHHSGVEETTEEEDDDESW